MSQAAENDLEDAVPEDAPIAVEQGEGASASPAPAPPDIEQLALARGFVTADQLRRASALAEERGEPLEATLLDLGLITPAQSTALRAFQSSFEDGPPPRPPLGTVVGNCLLLEFLGGRRGARTYRAHHLNLDLPVAVTVFDDATAAVRDLERFGRSARILARLDHPSIAKIYDFDDLGQAHIVTELVGGRSLRAILTERGRLEPEAVVWLALQLVEALEAAHRLGVAHRDLRPERVLVCEDDYKVKLVGFGLARAYLGGEAPVSIPGERVGTPGAMAPEQVEGRDDVDGRADYYALGVLLFEALCGEAPFRGEDDDETFRRQLKARLPLEKLRALGLPDDLPRLLLELTRKDRGARLTDPDALRGRLKDLAARWSLADAFEGFALSVAPEALDGRSTPTEPLDPALRAIIEDALEGRAGLILTELITAGSQEAARISRRLAEKLSELGMLDELRELEAEVTVAAPGDARAALLIGRAHRRRGAAEAGRNSLRRAALLAPDDALIQAEWLRSLLECGRRPEALAAADAFLETRGQDPAALIAMADFYYFEAGRPESALAALRGAVAERARDWVLWQRTGHIALELGRSAEAVQSLEAAAALAPGQALPYKLLAQAYATQSRREESAEALERALELEAKDLETREQLIAIRKLEGDWGAVASLAREGLALHPEAPQLSVALAACDFKRGDLRRASRSLTNVLESSPGFRPAKEGLIAVQKARRASRKLKRIEESELPAAEDEGEAAS